jgi:hypothetical protein
MATSRRPLVDKFDTTWLGDPDGPDFSIEIGDDAIVISTPSEEHHIAWSDIRELDVDIPTANWRAAVASQWFLSTMDMLESVSTNGVMNTSMRGGHKDIELRITRQDGTEVRGWARKHQALGYPRPEAEAARAVLQGRVGRSGG